jgi:beta-glucosidase
MRFPSGFVWGAATSSYQIEGATFEDGRGESVWDRFCRTPGKVADGATGDHACDHYHRWREDIALMQRLGLRAYRFSIAWPRVIPDGRGAVNPRGLDFYDRLVDGLLAAGIEPFPTLFHWDLPQPLEDAGGWPVRATACAFADYAELVGRRLGDRVRRFITHNEPWCVATLGYERGLHAPGRTDAAAALAAGHHLLLSHGWAAERLRSLGAEVGITLNLVPAAPATEHPADREACFAFDGQLNRWFLDPLFGRGYPTDVLTSHARAGRAPVWLAENDLADIAAPLDFLGVNYYSRALVRRADRTTGELISIVELPDVERTDMGWEVYPDGLCELLVRVQRDYAPRRIYVTENGASYPTGPDADGRVRDEQRLAFLREHLRAARRALDRGVPLAGYFVWSLLDNFEWDRGYAQRFGIIWVDYSTQARIPKNSGLWYAKVVETNGAEL